MTILNPLRHNRLQVWPGHEKTPDRRDRSRVLGENYKLYFTCPVLVKHLVHDTPLFHPDKSIRVLLDQNTFWAIAH